MPTRSTREPRAQRGDGAKIDARTTTLGQELQDLDAAYQKGLLTEKEYEQKRKAIGEHY